MISLTEMLFLNEKACLLPYYTECAGSRLNEAAQEAEVEDLTAGHTTGLHSHAHSWAFSPHF
jgi:hypothetical protein